MLSTSQLLRELIALPSVNPAFLPTDHPRAGEKSVAEFLAALSARAGLDVELREYAPNRPMVLARLSPSRAVRHRIVLAPHLDTINGSDPQFTPVVRMDRIYGRGACDTKGSVAAMFCALCDLAEHPSRPATTEILFAGLIDEEHAQLGSRALAASGLKAGLAIVGEPTCHRVVTAHKGNMWIRLETRGKSAHGSRPDLGDNAILSMSRVVEAIETDYAAHLRRRRHSLLGTPSVSVGVIAGGTQPNVVPDHCSIAIDRRTLPGEKDRATLRELARFVAAKGIRAAVSSDKSRPCPPLQTDPKLPLVASLLKAARQTRPHGADYFCDAAILASGGVPSVVFGPGDIAQAHTADEWVSLRSLERARAILASFFRRLP